MSAHDALLPCPFCASQAQLGRKEGSWGYYEATWWIECPKCRVRSNVFRSDDSDDGKAKAYEAWNRRGTINLAPAFVGEWHAKAVALGYDGVADLLWAVERGEPPLHMAQALANAANSKGSGNV